MTKHEKLILLLIVLVLLGRFSEFAGEVYIARTYGAVIPPDVAQNWKQVSILFGGLVNIGAAIWLYIEAKAITLKGWVWALSGLFFGLLGLVLFYAIQIITKKQTNET